MASMANSTREKIEPVNIENPEHALAAIRGVHEHLIRINKVHYLPQVRDLLARGAVLSDLVVGIMSYDSGVFPEEAMVAGDDGKFLGEDGKPACDAGGKPLWSEIGVRVRTRAVWREYLSKYKNDDGSLMYGEAIKGLCDTPSPQDETNAPGYFGIVFAWSKVTISTIYYQPDHDLKRISSTSDSA
jgi:hypothetical protein